ncbi:MAG: adenine phosphoribosyltransferase [Candidatus Diapherotrites archaeon CG10_big_fil_rev_8_21_14_0_10_31_34]|nr:MAG: adenine phosphoribosyltransferase [Candidatus Diapherotrites archaeon CG10_big_fil_rev_8_21_14_0_10_31_34]
MEDLKEKIRNIPDFPKKGIMFRDITTLLQDPKATKKAIQGMIKPFENEKIDVVIGTEARGFIFGAIIAFELGVSFVPVRKPGKLPFETEKASYEKEYGEDELEMHLDAIKKGDKVLVCDDLLATAGTAKAVKELVEKLGGEIIGFCFLIELSFLQGREKLKPYKVFSLIDYNSE